MLGFNAAAAVALRPAIQERFDLLIDGLARALWDTMPEPERAELAHHALRLVEVLLTDLPPLIALGARWRDLMTREQQLQVGGLAAYQGSLWYAFRAIGTKIPELGPLAEIQPPPPPAPPGG